MHEMNPLYREYVRDVISASPAVTAREFIDYIHLSLGAPQTMDTLAAR